MSISKYGSQRANIQNLTGNQGVQDTSKTDSAAATGSGTSTKESQQSVVTDRYAGSAKSQAGTSTPTYTGQSQSFLQNGLRRAGAGQAELGSSASALDGMKQASDVGGTAADTFESITALKDSLTDLTAAKAIPDNKHKIEEAEVKVAGQIETSQKKINEQLKTLAEKSGSLTDAEKAQFGALTGEMVALHNVALLNLSDAARNKLDSATTQSGFPKGYGYAETIAKNTVGLVAPTMPSVP